MAFLLIADKLMEEICAESDHEYPRSSQLRMYVGGSGGTGKSKIVQALQELFTVQNRSHWLRTCGPTGTAAVNVQGSTFFSLLGSDPRKQPSAATAQDSEAVRNKVAQRLQDCKFLFVDEISMVGAASFSQMDASIKSARGSTVTLSWAGLHVVAFGDFTQLKPIGQKSLADENAGNPQPKISAKPRRTIKLKSANAEAVALATRIGRELWLQLDTVIILEENMRHMHDPAYGQLLERLRNGKSTCCCCDRLPASRGKAAVNLHKLEAPALCLRQPPCDYHVLYSRVLTRDDPEAKLSQWNSARIITHSNPVAAAWNRDAVCQLAAKTGQPVLVSMAEDSLPMKYDALTDRETATS